MRPIRVDVHLKIDTGMNRLGTRAASAEIAARSSRRPAFASKA